ncbi:hypothetical protein PMAYCL1PPCAC_16294, partial [Pristionchus mayeri]
AEMTASKSEAIAPRCGEICPDYEIQYRIEKALLHPLEKDYGVQFVKAYTRSAATLHLGNPDLLRTPEALLRSVDYLLEVYDREELPFGLRFSFAEDRMRAVRQDSTITRISGEIALIIFEKQISFIIRSEYRARFERSRAFEAQLHATATEECFQKWSQLLADYGQANMNPSKLRREVAAAHCLKRAEAPESLLMAFEYRSIMGQDLFKTVFDLLLTYREGNSYGFFSLLSSLPASSLLRPACCPLVPPLRLTALATMAKAFKAPGIKLPLDVISAWLGFSSVVDARRCLAVAGVVVEGDGDYVLPAKMDVQRLTSTDRSEPVLIELECSLSLDSLTLGS